MAPGGSLVAEHGALSRLLAHFVVAPRAVSTPTGHTLSGDSVCWVWGSGLGLRPLRS